jgi:hypothetical protein
MLRCSIQMVVKFRTGHFLSHTIDDPDLPARVRQQHRIYTPNELDDVLNDLSTPLLERGS